MTENIMKNTQDTTTPPAPNGHGTNGTKNGETPSDAAASADMKDATTSSKKKKKKKGHKHGHNKPPESVAVETAAPAVTAPADVPSIPTGMGAWTTGTIDPPPPQPVAIEETAAAPSETSPAAPSETQVAAPIETPAAAPSETPVAAPIETLRHRMKVWTDPKTVKRYLMPSAFMRDVVNGQPVTDVMYAYAMRDDDTKIVTLTASEWNALPFFYFQEDGPAPRGTPRPVDAIG